MFRCSVGVSRLTIEPETYRLKAAALPPGRCQRVQPLDQRKQAAEDESSIQSKLPMSRDVQRRRSLTLDIFLAFAKFLSFGIWPFQIKLNSTAL